ncbi:carbohydrate ABC transporter permease [Marinilactibacillus psychrotolerans]|uniref:Sugar ABC transporter permease protein n=1 Tax=Marinilactibacillus psychrotolerans TaxID=191770 RepID=A0AAV3WP77_9LACT|nr:sugar ABC transporter permease [Marinilactibacillus psychrotolerans]GEL67168.1 ABC transporter permease [Marinilactibacillus psychrotolerans]GEQ35419.1 sugar ABC transporter permease protein [Marinilactibacillus psychrotolerans]SDC89860.1 multiple sugar transport system permease protein [Marinilactibacillus psychrotolerans]
METQMKRDSLKKRKLKERLTAYSFIAPNFIGFAIFTLGPIFFAIMLAFHQWDGSNDMTFIGLDNFREMFGDDRVKDALWNTIVYVLATVPLTLACALFLATLLNSKIKGRNIFRTIAFFPYVASLVAVAAVWNMIFHPVNGPINEILRMIGILDPPRWAADSEWAMFTLVLFSVWKQMGYYMVIFLAGLQGVSEELYEAANLDGAGRWGKFWHVTLPQLRPVTFFVLMILTINSFKVYDFVYMITQAGPGTSTLVLVYEIYNTAFLNWNLGYSSAISMLLLGLVLIVTLVQFLGEKKFTNQ